MLPLSRQRRLNERANSTKAALDVPPNTNTADSQTRAKLIDAATELMLSKGLAATRVDAICELAGLSKGAFFHYFADKQELAIAVLESWVARSASLFADAPFVKAKSAEARLHGYIDFVGMAVQQMPVMGCMVGVISQECAATNPPLREQCAIAFRDWQADIRVLLKDAAPKHVNARQLDVLAQHFLVIFEGALILARANNDPSLVAHQLKLYKDLLRYSFALK
jgi:TetR/AcrR family transcriptional regulator, transcriptional repressor for nem operon